MKQFPRITGDDMISSFDLRLWQLVQECLFRFGALVPFIYKSHHVPNGTRGILTYFVPRGSPHQAEIRAFLETETANIIERDDIEWLGTTIPGTDVTVIVTEFKGLLPYIDVETVRKHAAEMLRQLQARFGGGHQE